MLKIIIIIFAALVGLYLLVDFGILSISQLDSLVAWLKGIGSDIWQGIRNFLDNDTTATS